MDLNLDEWDFLSDDGFLDFNEEDQNQKKVLLGKHYSDSISVFDANYFICPSPRSLTSVEPPRNSRLPNQQLVPVPIPIRLEPRPPDDEIAKEFITKNNPIEVPSASIQKNTVSEIGGVEADQDSVSQVFFKMKENEFVDMKMDSPKSGSRGMLPPTDTMKFDDKGESMEIMISPRLKVEKELLTHKEDQDSTWEHNKDGFNLWKLSFTGIGAICSFGVAAATVCILFFGSQQRNKLHHNKIRFQIYADDKRINQVMQQANKMNEAISAATGIPLSRAHITYGGYHDCL